MVISSRVIIVQCLLHLLVAGAGQLGSGGQDCACRRTGRRARLLVALWGEGREESIETVVREDHSICKVIIPYFFTIVFYCFVINIFLRKIVFNMRLTGNENIKI